MKYLSGDFAAQYNRLIKEYKEIQDELDAKFKKKFSDLVSLETSRLEESTPRSYENGEIVKTYSGRKGKILSSHVKFEVTVPESTDFGKEVCGPSMYLPLDTDLDEAVMTLDGILRCYEVEFDSSVIEKDWGIDKTVEVLYADEIEKV